MKNCIIALLLFIGCTALAQNTPAAVSVYFDTDSYALKPSALKTLDSVSALFPEHEFLYIYGYTDDHGPRVYNDTLAMERAKAVGGHLSKFSYKGIDVYAGGKDAAWGALPDARKRRVTVYFGNSPVRYPQKDLVKQDGIIIAGLWCDSGLDEKDIRVKSYFDTRQMIANNVYAIDVEGNILQTAGMAKICLSAKAVRNLKGGYYTVKIPSRGRVDKHMLVWVCNDSGEGQVRWTQTDLTLTADGNFYTFIMPAKPGCLYVNLDRPCGQTRNPAGVTDYSKVVYVATHKSYNFNYVALKAGKKQVQFAAKVNDTL
jgi:OmpA family